VTAHGEELGHMKLGLTEWPVGTTIFLGDEPYLRVVDRIEPDDPEHHVAILVVEAVPQNE
jgi:hypothetical protein